MAQTTGIVSFMCKQKETDSVWQAVLDENKDGIYKAFTVVSAAFDWTSTGPNNLSTSTPRLSEEFYPYAVNNTIAHDSSLRRGNDLNMPEGKYFIECSYSSLLGLTRTALATMEIDNTKPVITDVTYRVGMTDIPLDGEIITEFTVGTGSGPGTDKKIHLSGRAYDGPPEFGVISAVYFKAYQKDDPGGYPGVPSAFYPDIAGGGITNRAWPVQTSGSPGWLSQPPKQDCIFGARFTDLDAGYSLDSNDFTLETTQSFGLDGDWRLWVCAQDGAGLTSFTYYDFTVNCVGPTTEWIRIDNAVTPYTVTPWDSSAGTAYIGERRLVTSFMVKDEVPLTNVKYMIYPKNTPMPPDGTNLPISLFPSHTEIGLVLVADSNGSEFQSAPVSYTLQVWGESAGPTGQKLEAFIEFEFLMSLAIVAPHYSAVDNGGAMWIGKDEQTAVATYLFNSITAVENKVVYDMSGTAVPGLSSGFGGSPPDLDAWLSNQTGTGTTDVLVILDQAQEDLITGDAFKHFYQDGTDGDAIVWMGNYPFSTYMKPDMTQGGTSGSGGFIDLLACGSTDDDCVSIYQYPVVNYQKISPVPGNGPGGNIYIPSLNDNNPNDFGSDSILRSAKVKSEGDSWGNSTLERTFTVRDDFAAGKRDSANFLTRHNSSNCRFASFFSYGKGSGGVNVSASPRSAEPPLDQASSNVIDTSPTDHRYVLNVIDDMLIEGITIYLNINGFDWEDYRIWLEGPNGVNVGGAIKMFNQQGDLESRDEHIDCTLPDEFPVNIDPGKNWAAFVDGDAALDQFVGTLSKGEWALHIYGDGGSVSGSILKWGLNLEGKNYIETDYSYPGTDKDQDNSSTLDDDPDTHYFEIVVPTAGIVTEVKVDLDYESDEIEDYRVWLARDSDNSGGSKLILKGVDVSADGGDDDSEWWYTHLRITATIPDDLGTITGVDVDGDSHTWSQLYDPEAVSQFEGKQAAATWRLYIASPGYNADGNSIKKAYPWGLKLKIATAVTGALRDPVTPAPFVIREFIENYMLNKGNPDASAKTIFYSADKTHQGDATPADEADQWDIYSYPNSSAGWTNLTTPNGDNAYVLGCAASGSRVYFATKQYTNSSSSLGPSPAYDDYSLFAIEGGSVHNIFEADVSGGGIFLPGQDGGDEEWCRGNGVDVASDGTVVFSASVKASNPLASWPNRVIYVTPRGGLSGVMTQITTGFGPSGTGTGLGHVEAAMLPHISDNGNWLSFSSKTVYGQVPSLGIDCRPPFSGSSTVGTTATTQIWRYNYSEMGSGNEYLRGWISKDTFFENIVPVHVDDYLDCMLTNSGETAVFSVIPNGGNIINVGFAMLDSNALWKQGRITRSTVAGSFAGGPGKVAIHNKGAGLPEIIFLTNVVGLDGLSPHLNDGSSSPIFDSSLQKNTTHYCQGAGEGLPTGALRLVYLSTPNGSFTLKELIVFTGTTDRKMFGNLEWSKDGKEVVFTGKFDQPFELPNDSGGVTTVPAMNGVWAVFRMALGADTEESDLSVNCAFSHVMPDKAIDYTDEGQTGSQPMFLTGFIAR
jgi:subtilisin-like proprotein convertase family protein